ncbi:unnamed protein product [marine sediment metagenome]|uniref:Uncharacterized protein n=1 Tax=marine sediment metagenome TaxID=412755 RepID=X1M9M5_9ZZZZ
MKKFINQLKDILAYEQRVMDSKISYWELTLMILGCLGALMILGGVIVILL